MLKVSRIRAKQLGLATYFTGKPCKHGHIAERGVDNGTCRDCSRIGKQTRRSKKLGYQTREQLDVKREASKRVCSACHKKFPNTSEFFQPLKLKRKGKPDWIGLSAECRECRRERFRKHYAEDPEHHVKRAMDYAKKYPEKKNARDMARYAATIAPQMPAWADQRKIETIYAIADFLTEKTGIVYQVDHVYPLKGKTMCGLHTHHNMRVITALANQKKGNRLDPEFDTWSQL